MSDDVDQVFQKLESLKLSESSSIETRIDYLRLIINAGNRNIGSENSEIIIIFGNTGCGKSTILNWLVGCTMDSNEEDDAVNVLPIKSGGKLDEVFPIGSEHIISKTIIPCIYPLTDAIVVCDCPGLADSRGSEFSIANAVNIMSILKSCASVGFLLLFNVHEILGLRGDGAKESLRRFIEMFGSIELVNKYSDNITIGITHANRSQLKKVLKIFLEICLQLGWQITENKINILDPLEKEGNISHTDFLNKLVNMPRICREQNFNLAPLAPKDILLINNIADELYLSCEKNWETNDINAIITNYQLLDSLLSIGKQPILLRAIHSIRELIVDNVQKFIDSNIFYFINNHDSNDTNVNRCNIFKSINFLKSLSVLDVCFKTTTVMIPSLAATATATPSADQIVQVSHESPPPTTTTTISNLIENTLQIIMQQEVIELNQAYNHWNTDWMQIQNELLHNLTTLANVQPQLLSDLNSTDINIIITLSKNVLFLNEVVLFVNKLKQDITTYPSYYYFGNQLDALFLMFQNDIESSIINMITTQIIPAKCELLIAKAIHSITLLTSQISNVIKSYHTNILELQLTCEENRIEIKLMKLVDFPFGFCPLELQQLLESFDELQKLAWNSTSLTVKEKKSNIVYNSMQQFWSQLISGCIDIHLNNIQVQLSELQLQFVEATDLIRFIISPFDLHSLSEYPLLTGPCQRLQTSLKLLSGCDHTVYQATMTTLSNVLLKLQNIQMKSVCHNISQEIERNFAEYSVNMRSDERGVLLLTPLTTLFNINEEAYDELIVKMIMSCKTMFTNEVRNIQQLPLSEYRKACLRFEQHAEQYRLLFTVLKVPIDMNILLSMISSAKLSLKDYEGRFLQDTKNELIAESKNVIEIIKLAIDKYIQQEESLSVAENKKCQLLQSDTVVQILHGSNCLTKNIAVVIEEFRKKAALVERAVVFSDMGNVRLLELVEALKSDIATAVTSANVELLYGESRHKIKAKIIELFEVIEKSVEINPGLFCMRGNLTLVNLQTKKEFTHLSRSILIGLKELKEQDRIVENKAISESLTAVRTRASVLHSFQLSALIDGWCVSNTVGANIKELKDAFNTLKRLGTQCYVEKKSSFAIYCHTLQDIGQIQNAIRAKNFNDIFTRRELLLKLQQSIPTHVNVTVEVLDGAIDDFMTKMFENAVEEIERSVVVDNFLDFSQLREFMEVCRGLKSLTAHCVKILEQKAVQIFGQLFGETRRAELMTLATSPNIDLENMRLRDFAKRFVKYYAVARELDITRDFVHRMGNILAEIPAPVTDALSRHISELQGVSALTVVCSEIFDAFKVFSRINVAEFNRIAGQVTFDDALLTVNSKPPCNKTRLKQSYLVFVTTYNLILTDIVNKCYNYPKQHEQIQALCQQIGPDCYQLSNHIEDTAKLVAYICGHYSYTDAKETYFSGAKDSLLQVHSTQILSIFLLLGIDQPGRATGQLNQVLTGEGKSITLAIVASVYALLGVNTTIICFSSYLTHKDSKLFECFYQSLDIGDYISYSTISDLVDDVMDESLPDLRAQVTSYLKGEIVERFIPKTEMGVLLIDEVDVFFGEDFYGELQHPVIDITTEPAHDMIKFMWNNRMKLNSMSIIEAEKFVKLKIMKQIDLLVKEFPRLRPLLPPIIKDCCQVLRLYHSVVGVSTYDCFIENDQIAFIDHSSGSTEYYSGHSVMFQYCFHHEQYRSDGTPFISHTSFRKHVGLTISCGKILYAELPKRFHLVHGVTGTLASFQGEQNAILKNYGFKRKSFIPSTFQKLSPVVIPTTVITGDRNRDYFDRIKQVMHDKLRSHRAVLVFFETYEILERFRKELIKKPITLPNYRLPEILSEHLTPNKRDGVISRAINTCKITLCTKLYMRGTDFKCRDTQLVKNGGVHVLLTFYPDTETDEIQARGRTCRQNDPGSFQMILFAQDLVDKGFLRYRKENGIKIPDLSEADEIQLGQSIKERNRWDVFLKRKREAAVVRSSKMILNTLAKNRFIHDKTLHMSQFMESGDSRASEYLITFQE